MEEEGVLIRYPPARTRDEAGQLVGVVSMRDLLAVGTWR